uniref:Biogenesis of lysosome-related organelles complex 1 subunit 1 n=1 Tax=Timema genevievae TaxID=629358 RepID=A0A7R9JQ56_TIMGE|nr:unnamed protein product [Timema genevievae]
MGSGFDFRLVPWVFSQKWNYSNGHQSLVSTEIHYPCKGCSAETTYDWSNENQWLSNDWSNNNKWLSNDWSNGNQWLSNDWSNGNKWLSNNWSNGNKWLSNDWSDGSQWLSNDWSNGNKWLSNDWSDGEQTEVVAGTINNRWSQWTRVVRCLRVGWYRTAFVSSFRYPEAMLIPRNPGSVMARGDGVDVEEYDNRKHGWPRSSTQAQEQKRKEAMAAANNLTQALVDHLNVGSHCFWLEVSCGVLTVKVGMAVTFKYPPLHLAETHAMAVTFIYPPLHLAETHARIRINSKHYVVPDSVATVAQAYLNQKRLDAEAKQLHHNATNFAKQTHQWANLVESFSSALKEIGDAENWAQSIEADMRTITSALEYSYKGLTNNICTKGSLCPFVRRRGIEHRVLVLEGNLRAQGTRRRGSFLPRWRVNRGLSTHTPFQFDCQIQTTHSLGDRKSTALNTSAEGSKNGCRTIYSQYTLQVSWST